MTEEQVIRTKIATRSSVRQNLMPDDILMSESSADADPMKISRPSHDHDKKRNHCLWPTEDKDMFFEALNEYGKDFECIQNVFSMRSKRRSDSYPIAKTKDQIRHFYYRTWNKISKYVDEIEGISKDVLEVYGLINYGHLRKKIGSKFDSKIGIKLNTLIHYGTIQITVKCRNTRIRTPLCRALKKLNNIDVEDSHCKINLIPYNHTSWTKIQALSLNPRLCIKLKTDAMLTDIFAYVNTKWPVYTKGDQMILKFHLLKKLDTNPLSFKRADVRMMSNYIVNNNGVAHTPLPLNSMESDCGDDLDAQEELDEALKLLRNLQEVIDCNGGFTAQHCDNITINRLRTSLSNVNVLSILYEWMPLSQKCLLYERTSSLKRLIHLATTEFAQHDRTPKKVATLNNCHRDTLTGGQLNTSVTSVAPQTNAIKSICECYTFDTDILISNSRNSIQVKAGNITGGRVISTGMVQRVGDETRPKNNTFKIPHPPESTIVIRPRTKTRLRTKTIEPLISNHAQLSYSIEDSHQIPFSDDTYTPEEVINQEQNFSYNNDIGKINDDEWSISSDFSLSSFLYDSPMKKLNGDCFGSPSKVSLNQRSVMNTPVMNTSATYQPNPDPLPQNTSELSVGDSIGRIDIETTLNCLIHESSLDYASKFASLTGQK